MSNRQLREVGAMRNFMDQLIRPDLENLAHRVDSLELSNDKIRQSISNIDRDLQRTKDDTLHQIHELSANLEIMNDRLDNLSNSLGKLLTILDRKGIVSLTNPGKVSNNAVNSMSNDHTKTTVKSASLHTNPNRCAGNTDTSEVGKVTPPKEANSSVLSPINVFGQGSVSTNQRH